MVNSCNIGLLSCKRCNGHKAKLEDDISAITMLPGPDGTYAREDERLIKTSIRKLKGSISAHTKKRVSESHPKTKIQIPFGNAQFTFDLTGQPNIDDGRAAWLAWSQIQGLWFHQTYDKDRRSGHFMSLDKFVFVGIFSRFDWGNVQLTSFAAQIKDWQHQTYACLADGYFRAVIKAAPDGSALAWAVEWNENYRAFGYWSYEDKWKAHFDLLTPLRPDHMVGDTTNGWAYRQEIRLADDAEDTLFAEPPDD